VSRIADRAGDRRAAGGPAGPGRQATILSVETASEAMLELLDPDGCAPMLLSGRARQALGLANEREAASPDHRSKFGIANGWTARRRGRWPIPRATSIGADRAARGDPVEHPECASAALTLARLAGLLPALWLVEADTEVSIDPADDRCGHARPSRRLLPGQAAARRSASQPDGRLSATRPAARSMSRW
jgi:GTP cyclohydrolase II